ncbi:hypothetical protein EDB86DRAFT_3005420, partial [Lactarius hatsudake]
GILVFFFGFTVSTVTTHLLELGMQMQLKPSTTTVSYVRIGRIFRMENLAILVHAFRTVVRTDWTRTDLPLSPTAGRNHDRHLRFFIPSL